LSQNSRAKKDRLPFPFEGAATSLGGGQVGGGLAYTRKCIQ